MADLEQTARATPAANNLGEETRAFVALALPMVVSRIGVAAMGIADGVMLARHSAGQLAVNGLAENLMGRYLEVTMIFVTAGIGLAAQARAGGHSSARQVGPVWHNALALSLVCGGLALLLGLLGGQLLAWLGQPVALLADAGTVLAVLSLGVAPALMALVCAGMLEALGRPVVVAVAVVLANGLNIALNQWFIYGGAGLPAGGAQGAAWSTTGVRIALAAVLLAAVWWLHEQQRYALRQPFSAATWRAGAEQRQRGLAGAGNVAVLALLSLGLPVMAGWMGAQAVAQMTALFLALAPAMVVAWGMGDAAGLRVAALHGQAQAGLAQGAGALRGTGARLAVLLLAVLALAILVYSLAPRAGVAWAAYDPQLVAGVLPLLPWGLAALAGDAVGVFYSAMLRSLGVLKGPFLLHLGTGCLLLPLAWLLAFPLGWGLAGLLAAHAAMAAVRALALAFLYDRHAGQNDRQRQRPNTLAAA